MKPSRMLAVPLLGLLLGADFARAQEPTEPATEAPAAPAATPAAESKAPAERAEFEKLFGEWKDLLTKMRELQFRFQATKKEDRPPLEKEFETISTTGKELQKRVAAAAEAYFVAAPNEMKEAGDFLGGHRGRGVHPRRL